MARVLGPVGLILASVLAVACGTAVPGATNTPLPPTSAAPPATAQDQPTAAPPVTPAAADDEDLLPDPAADYTVGDTAVLAAGEYVGDQGELTVEQAVRLGTASFAGHDQYAFLVVITGRDPDTFHFNLLNFKLIDEQDFQYPALSSGGVEPRLEFGDLAEDQRVRGWLTFEVPTETATLRLEYSPLMALEPATFGFIVP